MTTYYPAPWNLKGKGYILIYKFSRDFIKKQGRVPDFLEGRFVGGLGSVMLVDYSESNAGPYGELLFIPGKFKYKGKKLHTISKIYVSTMESVENGKENWGIPKEQAGFEFGKLDDCREYIKINVGGRIAAELTIRTCRLSFPVNTKLLPFPLIQRYEEKDFYTTFSGSGKGKLAKLEKIKINPELFPDVSIFKPIALVKVEPFAIIFPVARIENV